MTTNPPDEADVAEETTDEAAADEVAAFAERVAGIVESEDWSAAFGNAKVRIDRSRWVEAVAAVRDGAGLGFFSFLSAIDWSNDVSVGEPLEETVEERYEVLVRLSSGRNNDAVTLSTDIPKDDASLPTLSGVFGGANWHEREAAEMFGIRFEGHPNPGKLYLSDEFEGFPLLKSYPLLSREIKPWPGTVDVEDMPSTENPEADSGGVAEQLPSNAEGVAVASDEGEADGRGPGAASPEGEL